MNLLKPFCVILILVTCFPTSMAFGRVWVNAYYRKDGTYVRGHWRSDPDGITSNNFSANRSYSIAPYPVLLSTKARAGRLRASSAYKAGKLPPSVMKQLTQQPSGSGAYSSSTTDAYILNENDENKPWLATTSQAPKYKNSTVVSSKIRTAEEVAQGRLRLAKKLLEMGQVIDGKKWLADIIREFPDTNAAQEAMVLLESLG